MKDTIQILQDHRTQLLTQLEDINCVLATLITLDQNNKMPTVKAYRKKPRIYSEETVAEVRRLHATGQYTARQMAKLTGVNYASIRNLYLKD